MGKPKQFRFGFGVSLFSLFGVSAETLFSAETACFGRNTLFQLILATHFSKKSFAKTAFFGRKSVSAEILVSDFHGCLVSVSVFRPKICFVCPLMKTNFFLPQVEKSTFPSSNFVCLREKPQNVASAVSASSKEELCASAQGASIYDVRTEGEEGFAQKKMY